MESLDLEQSPPPLWPLYEGLAHVPLLAIRGEHTDLLSRETLAEMAARHPRFSSLEVPGQGHAPLLEGETARRIATFIDAAEADGDRYPPESPVADAPEEVRMPRAT